MIDVSHRFVERGIIKMLNYLQEKHNIKLLAPEKTGDGVDTTKVRHTDDVMPGFADYVLAEVASPDLATSPD
nr:MULTISPECIES: hypothetical protein [Bradyrhizobium]